MSIPQHTTEFAKVKILGAVIPSKVNMGKWVLSLKDLVGKGFTPRGESLRIKRLEDEISELKNELSRLNGIVASWRLVDLVDFGELRVFMYTNDLSYIQLNDKYRRHTPSANKRDFSKPYRSASERYHNGREPLLSFLLSHYWLHDLDFAVFDVGCQYGTSAMAAAQVILSSGHTNHVYAFDPGEAGRLARYNIILNGLESHVTFECLAVSKGTFPGLVFTETGHSENNRLVNRTPTMEASSMLSCVHPSTSTPRGRICPVITLSKSIRRVARWRCSKA